MGNVEKMANFLLEEPRREQLFPLFEEVFGITSQTLQDFQRKGIGIIHIKHYHFYKMIMRLQMLRHFHFRF